MNLKEFYQRSIGEHLGALTVTALLGGAILSVCLTTEYPPESLAKHYVVEPALHQMNVRAPWEDLHQTKTPPASDVGAGHLALDTYLDSVTTYVEAKASLNSEVFGVTIDSSNSTRTGFVVNRLKVPGIDVADTRTNAEATFITRYKDGKDVGIDLTDAKFEMLAPESADYVNGTAQCAVGPEDPLFTGCVTGDSIREGFWSQLPIVGDDPHAQIYNDAEMLFYQYAQIEPCDFDAILIPAINSVYAGLKDKGVNFVVDGDNRYEQVIEILFRAHYRDQSKSSHTPQSLLFHLKGQYQAIPDLRTRLEDIDKRTPFSFKVPSDYSPDFCAKGPGNTVPFGFSNVPLDKFKDEIAYLAVMGLPEVPAGYDPNTRTFVTSGFNAPSRAAVAALEAAA